MRALQRSLVCVFALGAAAAGASAQQRAHGPVYEIVEPDMLAGLMEHLREKERSGELARLLQQGRARAEQSIRTPAPVSGLSRSEARRSWVYDPTLEVTQDILTPDGTVIARRGERVNPLDHVPFASTWLFFDATDRAQLDEARRVIATHRGVVKPILVAGDWSAARKSLNHRVYFDQHGLLVRRFGIQAVPAVLRREGSVLRIEEYPVR